MTNCVARAKLPVEHRIKEICRARVRYGYRRVHVLLRRQGWRHGQNQTRVGPGIDATKR
ncbi:IS3 family transposase [Bradyrhizobium yuanmingense]|nr:IS3 family transposase [Bradyrhizobium yuanmingense]